MDYKKHDLYEYSNEDFVLIYFLRNEENQEDH